MDVRVAIKNPIELFTYEGGSQPFYEACIQISVTTKNYDDIKSSLEKIEKALREDMLK